MTSLKKIKSNKRNARKSTGPRTKSGKSRSATNAIRHKLSIPVEHSEHDEGLICDIVSHLLEGIEPSCKLTTEARGVACSIIEVARVREAKNKVWQLASVDLKAKFHGVFYGYDDELDFFWPKNVQRGIRKLMPEAFEKPFSTEDERNAAITKIVSKSLNKIIRYERRAINRRNSAILAFDMELSHMTRTD